MKERGLPDPFVVHPGLEYEVVLQLIRFAVEGISAQNHKVGVLAGFDLALGVFLEAGVGSGFGEVVEGFLNGEGLAREVEGTAVEVSVGDGTLDVGRRVEGFHRAVAAVADSAFLLQQSLPGIAACG